MLNSGIVDSGGKRLHKKYALEDCVLHSKQGSSKEGLVKSVELLKRSKVKEIIETRIHQFMNLGRSSDSEIFKELCYCILCANCSAKLSWRIQEAMDEEFFSCTEPEMAKNLRLFGYRFPNIRAKYIVQARPYKDKLKNIISALKEEELRNWTSTNIKGIGLKEASHFLRNIGFMNYAIIDFHIVDLLTKFHIIDRPRAMTSKRYYEIELILSDIAQKTSLTLAELDLYLWFLETGEILK